jgi:parallel beta-helix repeat protein
MRNGLVISSKALLNATVVFSAIALFIFTATSDARDYTTPGRGEIFDLYALAALSGGAVQFYGSYFQLNGNVTISPGDTLYIAGGQLLLAADDPTTTGYCISIAGRLLAYGYPHAYCMLSSHTNLPGRWYGIKLLPSSTRSIMSYCAISNAVAGISCYGASPGIDHCLISQCKYAGIYCYGAAEPIMSDNTILSSHSGAGIVLGRYSKAVLSNNTITDNLAGVVLADPWPATSVANNRIAFNAEIGLYAAGYDESSIRTNQIEWNNAGMVIAGDSVSTLDGNTVSGNTLLGIATAGNASPRVRNSIITENYTTIGGFVVFDSSRPDLGFVEYPGRNTFHDNLWYDLVNFTTNNLLAFGNSWTAPHDIDAVIYDDEEDIGDADGNGFISGIVHYEATAAESCWQLYR